MRLTLIIPLVLGSGLGAGCVDHDASSFYIVGVSTPDDECIYSPDSPRLLRGTFNAQFGNDYVVFPILANQLVDRGGTAPLRADPNSVLVTGAIVELQDAAGATISFPGLPNPFTVSVSDFVGSSDGTSPHLGVGAVQVIPPAYAAGLDDMLGTDPFAQMVVIAAVQVFGETTGGVDVDALPWSWPIDVCQGRCLFSCVDPSSMDTGDENRCECGSNYTCTALTGTGPCA